MFDFLIFVTHYDRLSITTRYRVQGLGYRY